MTTVDEVRAALLNALDSYVDYDDKANDAIDAFEAAVRAAALDEPDWDGIWQAFALVFSFIPDADERAEVAKHYAALDVETNHYYDDTNAPPWLREAER